MTVDSEVRELCAELRKCEIKGCFRVHEARGMCTLHYKRWKNHGNPLAVNPNRTTHGASNTKEFNAWCQMKARCTNPNLKVWSHYGGRGIKVCDRWQQSFKNFYEDMGQAPSPLHSIERRNNDGDYTSDNCYWADKKTQGNNTRRNRFVSHNGRTQTIAQWADELEIKYSTLRVRLDRGWTPERALSCIVKN